jgi:hypothetical protein
MGSSGSGSSGVFLFFLLLLFFFSFAVPIIPRTFNVETVPHALEECFLPTATHFHFL